MGRKKTDLHTAHSYIFASRLDLSGFDVANLNSFFEVGNSIICCLSAPELKALISEYCFINFSLRKIQRLQEKIKNEQDFSFKDYIILLKALSRAHKKVSIRE